MLVWHDLLGLYDGTSPRFVKRYADLATTIRDAVAAYAADVRARRFPEDVHTYAMPEEELAAFRAAVGDGQQRPLGHDGAPAAAGARARWAARRTQRR